MATLREQLFELTDREFEHFLGELWAARGWDTKVTRRSNDDGIDIIAVRDEHYRQKRLIQAKHGQEGKRISRSRVQQYSYLHHKKDVDEVLFVTTGTFTDGARESAATANVKLIDIDTLVALIEDTATDDALSEFNIDRPPVETDPKPEPISTVDSGPKGQIEDYARSNDVFARLLATLGAESLNLRTRLATLLQLFRGDDRIHLLFMDQTGDAAGDLFNTIADLRPESRTVDCTRADEAAIFGQYHSFGEVSEGLLRSTDDNLLLLKRAEEMHPLQSQLREPMEENSLSVAKGEYHERFPVDCSVIATGGWKYGAPDQHEQLQSQISVSSAFLNLFDAVCFTEMEYQDVNDEFKRLFAGPEDSTTPVEPIRFREHIHLANQYDPAMTAAASVLLRRLEAIIKNADRGGSLPVSNLRQSLEKFARAVARIRLSERVTPIDVEMGLMVLPDIQLRKSVDEILEKASITDGTINESPITKREQIKRLRTLIEEMQPAEDAVPIDEVRNQAKQIGFSPIAVQRELDKLRDKGEAYKPKEGHIRIV